MRPLIPLFAVFMVVASLYAYAAHVVSAVSDEARHAPLFGISGTDPQRLDTALDALEQARGRLAAAQTDPLDSARIGFAYPVEFLRLVARTETARLEFMQAPSYARAREYERLLAATADEGVRSAYGFVAALDAILDETETPAVYTLSGLIDEEALRDAGRSLLRRQRDLATESRRRFWCRRNPFCTRPEVIVPSESQPVSERNDEAAAFFLAARRGTTTPAFMRVHVNRSACARELPPPYEYLLLDETRINGRPHAHLLDDVFFSPTSGQGEILRILSRSVEYAIVRPSLFYMCPETQTDAGLFAAFLAARRHAGVATEDAQDRRDAFLADPSDATLYAYVSALSAIGPDDLASSELRLMTIQRNGRLDALVSDIARVIDAHLKLRAQGVPFDMSARNMYVTHSAFPSLYLAHDASVMSEAAVLGRGSPEALAQFMASHETLSRLIARIGRGPLIDAAKALRDFDSP